MRLGWDCVGDRDIDAKMIKQGHAWASRQYLRDPEYSKFEHKARSTGTSLPTS